MFVRVLVLSLVFGRAARPVRGLVLGVVFGFVRGFVLGRVYGLILGLGPTSISCILVSNHLKTQGQLVAWILLRANGQPPYMHIAIRVVVWRALFASSLGRPASQAMICPSITTR